LFTLVTLINW